MPRFGQLAAAELLGRVRRKQTLIELDEIPRTGLTHSCIFAHLQSLCHFFLKFIPQRLILAQLLNIAHLVAAAACRVFALLQLAYLAAKRDLNGIDGVLYGMEAKKNALSAKAEAWV